MMKRSNGNLRHCVLPLVTFIGRVNLLLEKYLLTCKSYALNADYRDKIKRFGKGSVFNGVSFVSGYESIEIGNNVHIGNNAFIRGEGGLVIEDNTHISRNIVIYTYSHEYEGDVLPYDDRFRRRAVFIGKNVWIGMNVVILPGATVEEGAIIGGGAVVKGIVPKGSIYGAAHAEKIALRDMDRYSMLEKNKLYGGVDGIPLHKLYEKSR
ncbi:MAG: acyltransferase [Candidatus Thiodiazotropha sp.]